MIPSAKMAIRPRPPPENRFSRPRMLLPPKFLWIELTACELIPGAGMCVPRRYSARISAVNRTLLRISATLNAPRIVEIIGGLRGPQLLRDSAALGEDDQLAGAAGGLDLLSRRPAEPVRMHG